jgi:glycosyltransferase involved in cell wall biosynthesis
VSAGAQESVRRTPVVLMLVNVSWFFVSHRLQIALGAIEAGFSYHVATRFFPEADRSHLRSLGIHTHDIPFSRGGANPVADVRSLIEIYGLLRRLRPDLLHLVTLKAIIFGGILSRVLRVPAVVAAVPGLGYSFVATGAWARVRRNAIEVLLRLALDRVNCCVVFQNPDDQGLLVRAGVVTAEQTVLIRGAGVDMSAFRPEADPPCPVRVVLASRMLREKGVPYFVEAARALRARGVSAEFLLAGNPDPDNPGSISHDELTRWHVEGHVSWLGHVADMSSLLGSVHVVCLPTHYGEGVPKVLIEAAAAGRAIVATDVPGCREIVKHDDTGLLVSPRDVDGLACALQRLIEDRDLRQRLGRQARRLAEASFATEQVVGATLDVYRQLLERHGPV